VLFFPDQHLGRNTALAMGYGHDDMRVWNPRQERGGLSEADCKDATLLLWKGHCSVHQRFTPRQVAEAREKYPDVTVIVVDASRLERNLNLALQVLEITDKAVLCLNLMDEAKRHGIHIDARTLAKDLGIPVVPASARSGEGIPELIQTMYQVASGEIVCKPHRIKNLSKPVFEAVEELTKKLDRLYPSLPNTRWLAMRLLDGDQRILNALVDNEFEPA